MPIPVIGLHNEDKVFVNGSCVLNEERFMLIGSFVAFFIPLVIMVVTYCLTIQVLASSYVLLILPVCPYFVFFCLTTTCLPFFFFITVTPRCSRGRPLSSCTRQRLPPSSLCTHQQWQIRYSLQPALSTFLRSTQSLLQTHKVKADQVKYT